MFISDSQFLFASALSATDNSFLVEIIHYLHSVIQNWTWPSKKPNFSVFCLLVLEMKYIFPLEQKSPVPFYTLIQRLIS